MTAAGKGDIRRLDVDQPAKASGYYFGIRIGSGSSVTICWTGSCGRAGGVDGEFRVAGDVVDGIFPKPSGERARGGRRLDVVGVVSTWRIAGRGFFGRVRAGARDGVAETCSTFDREFRKSLKASARPRGKA